MIDFCLERHSGSRCVLRFGHTGGCAAPSDLVAHEREECAKIAQRRECFLTAAEIRDRGMVLTKARSKK